MTSGKPPRWRHKMLRIPNAYGVATITYCPQRSAHRNLMERWADVDCPLCWAALAKAEGLTMRELAERILREVPDGDDAAGGDRLGDDGADPVLVGAEVPKGVDHVQRQEAPDGGAQDPGRDSQDGGQVGRRRGA